MEGILQLLKFTAVGFVNTFIDWGIYLIVLKTFPAESVLFIPLLKGLVIFAA